MKYMLFLVLALPALVSASTVLTNSPAWNGTDGTCCWGDDGSTPTFGETITVPTNGDNVLDYFEFVMSGAAPSANLLACVQAWGGSATTGSPTCTPETTPAAAGAYIYQETLDVSLTPGGVYLLYFTSVGVAQTSLNNTGFEIGATLGDSYSGGKFEFTNADLSNPSAGNISDLNSATWSAAGGYPDVAFVAEFTSSAVPEPASLVLSATALAAIGLLRLRRKTT